MTSEFKQEAKQLSLLFDLGVISEREVIEWADAKIVEMTGPPQSLLELAVVNRDDAPAIIHFLHELSAGVEFWPALGTALSGVREFLVKEPGQAANIANALYRLICGSLSEAPSDFKDLYRFDDAFSLAEAGIVGDIESVRREFIEELGRF